MPLITIFADGGLKERNKRKTMVGVICDWFISFGYEQKKNENSANFKHKII